MRSLIIGTTIAALLAAGPLHGDITVLKIDGTEADSNEATSVLDPDTGGWNIELLALYAPGEFTVYNIHGDGGEVIDDVVVAVPGQTGSPVIVNIISDTEAGISTVRSIRQTGTAETILNTVNVRQDIGLVDVDEVGIMNAGRDVIGPVHARIDAALRGINMIEAQRDILGDITADNGRIIFILSYGRLGTAANPVTVRAKHDIIQIGSYGGIWGDVNSRHGGGAGRMFAFGATSFHGTLETESLMSNPYNGWPGRINVLEHFDATVHIGGSLVDPQQWIELPPTGFSGQIVINADNDANGNWTSPVYVGTPENPVEILEGPHYKETPAEIGGGAVGLVPFALHETACVPPLSGVLQGGPGATVRLRHYGPVRITDATPFVVERHVINTGDPYVEVPASEFEYCIPPDDHTAVDVVPVAGHAGFEPGYRYRISPTTSLVSDVAVQPPVRWVRPYVIAVEGVVCPSDIDGDGTVGMAELLEILFAWGDCKECPGDLNGDGVVGYADVLEVLRDWGPCS